MNIYKGPVLGWVWVWVDLGFRKFNTKWFAGVEIKSEYNCLFVLPSPHSPRFPTLPLPLATGTGLTMSESPGCIWVRAWSELLASCIYVLSSVSPLPPDAPLQPLPGSQPQLSPRRLCFLETLFVAKIF